MSFFPKGRTLVGSVPLGSVFAFAGTGLPNKWLLCDGSAFAFTQSAATTFNISLFKELYDVIGQTYAPSTDIAVALDSLGVFMVPNLVGKIATGSDPEGDVINEPAPIGTYGGQNEVTLEPQHLPEHFHYFMDYHANHAIENDTREDQVVTVDAFGIETREKFGNNRSERDNRPFNSFWNRTGTSVYFERFGANGPDGDNRNFRFHNLSSAFYQDTNFDSANYTVKWYIPPFGGKDAGNDEPHNNVPSFLALKYLIRAVP